MCLILLAGLFLWQGVARACGGECVLLAEGPAESLTRTSGQAVIGDYVWLDVDGNGLQDDAPVPGIESTGVGLADVGIQIYRDDGDGVFEPQGDDALWMSTITGSDGSYTLNTAITGTVWVAVDRDTLPGGLRDVGGVESVISPHLLTMMPGEVYDAIDFGFTAGGTVGGTVFFDRDLDGQQGLIEEGVEDAEICLYKDSANDDVLGADDLFIACVRTDDQGNYIFYDVLYGDFLVVETPRPDVGHITSAVVSVQLNPWAVSGASANPIGDVLLAGFTGVTFLDSNGNGVRDSEEIYGAKELVITATNLETGESFSTVSKVTGAYELQGLMPGTYQVTATSQAAHLAATTATELTLALGFGESLSGVNFGYLTPTEVNLVDFTANAWGSAAILQWRTSYEYEQEGFWVWRAPKEAGPYEIVSALIPATNDPGGAVYQWMDLSVGRGQTYWYKLQTTPDGGLAGPIPVRIEPGPGDMTSWVFTPFVVR